MHDQNTLNWSLCFVPASSGGWQAQRGAAAECWECLGAQLSLGAQLWRGEGGGWGVEVMVMMARVAGEQVV